MIDAGKLLKELDDQWRQAGKGQGAGVLRACSMTLLVITRGEDDPQELSHTLARLASEYPGRTILLRLKRDDRAGLSARTSVDCWTPFGRRQQICAERIEIETGLDDVAGVPPMVLGLAVPDLPVVCWIRSGALAWATGLRPVISLAGRAIADTAREEDAAASLAAVKEISSATTAVGDLAWTRITRWRRAIFTAFESGACRKRLNEASEAEIGWAGAGAPTTAVYLAAWLRGVFPEARLSLRMCDPVKPGKGRIRLVRLAGNGMEIRLARPEGTDLRMTMDGLNMAAVFPALDEADLLREELLIFGRDAVFEEALGRSGEILRLVED